MICNNCDRSIKDGFKVCPYCGFVLERHEIGATEHHNFALDSEKAHNLKLTDEIIPNYGFSYKFVADAVILFKDPIFWILNFLSFAVYDFFLYFYINNIVITLTYAVIINFFTVVLELLFYKTNDRWYKGLVPVYNILNLYKLYIRDYKAVYRVIYALFFFTTLWTVSLFIVYFLLAGAYVDSWLPIVSFFFELEIYILAIGFIVYGFKSFYNVGYRFRINPYLVIFIPIFFIPYIAFNKELYYHEDQRV